MAVSIQQVEAGVSNWVSGEILCKTEGLAKWVLGAGLVGLPAMVERKYNEMRPYLCDIGIAMEDGRIDLERAESILLDVANRYGRVSQRIAGIDVKLGPEDISSLARYIQQS